MLLLIFIFKGDYFLTFYLQDLHSKNLTSSILMTEHNTNLLNMVERHLSSFVLLVLSVIRDSFRKRKWLWSLSYSSAPCEKELYTPVGWLLPLSHKYTIWALVSFRFLSLWYIVVPRCHCWHWLASGYTFLIHTVRHTNYCLSQVCSSQTLTTICLVVKVQCPFRLLLQFWAAVRSNFVFYFVQQEINL